MYNTRNKTKDLKMTITNDARKTFIDYFVKQGHIHVPSASLIPNNDPTLMFANSGMVQFKNYFTGAEKPPYTRATTFQKSVRAGGKHNDLDNVGYTVRHHTFFEMLGNFSFGDYFKDEAIHFAWELLTKGYGIPKKKLYITVFHKDEEALQIWKKITGFSEDKIIKIATKDNFWQMGDTGPCGPCSEIFYDHGDKIFGGLPGTPNEDGDRFIEIWNLVFDQFEDLPNGTRINIPKPCIDTGSGLERISAVLHGTNDNFNIDIFRALIEKAADLTNTNPNGPHKISLRVIADHLRSSAFLIADGILPSNEGRGYVLRRIMRRAMRHIHLIGYKDSLMYRLVECLKQHMGDVYPELKQAQGLIEETLKLEENKFKQTLDKGLKLLDLEVQNMPSSKTFSGETAFRLYDTYGFPLDLTQDVLRAKGIQVNVTAFNQAMDKSKQEARKTWAGSGETATESVWFNLSDKIPTSEFLGYTENKAQAEIIALVKDGKIVTSLGKDDKGYILTNQTPFYAEMGGQIGDSGTISSQGAVFTVTDTQKKLGRFFAHFGKVTKGSFNTNTSVAMQVDMQKRFNIQGHHSATHLLQASLQKVLGKNVQQKGSYVADDKLRFDFSNPRAMTAIEIQQTEEFVNKMILQNVPAITRLMSPDEAIKQGAMALFGEKYGETVRVVSFGQSDCPLSIELCGGTHVQRTGDIGLFKILCETAVSSGVRRIEAIAGITAYQYIANQEETLFRLSSLLKTTPDKLTERIVLLMDDKKKLEKQIVQMRQKATVPYSENDKHEDIIYQGLPLIFIAKELNEVPAKELKGMVDQLKQSVHTGIIMLVSTNEDKVSIVIGITNDLTPKINAVELVKIAAQAVGGNGGGGRPDMAQAGGSQPEHIRQAIQCVRDILNKA